ncbi:MAG: hypothetical protein ACRCSK_04040 [Fusobacteriaceae bacterium]
MKIIKLLIMTATIIIASTAIFAKDFTSISVQEEKSVFEQEKKPTFSKGSDVLRIESVGQELEYSDRRTPGDMEPSSDGTPSGAAADLSLTTSVTLEYQLWTFDLEATSNWVVYRADYVTHIQNDPNDPSKGTTVSSRKMERDDGSITLSAERDFGVGRFHYSIGSAWEHTPSYDQFILLTTARYGIYSALVNPRYSRADSSSIVQNNQDFYVLAPRNSVGLEIVPVQLTVLKTSMGSFSVAYFADIAAANGTPYGTINQQVRLYFPVYRNRSWKINGEYRGTLSFDTIGHDGKARYGRGRNAEPFKVNRFYGYVTYEFENGLEVRFYGLYEVGLWKNNPNYNIPDTKSNLYETGLRWTYYF